MDPKSLTFLEYPLILENLAGYCAFSASAMLARALQPAVDPQEVTRRLAETTEARRLLAVHPVDVGGAHDVRPAVDLASRGGVLEPRRLLEIRSTLIVARQLKRLFERMGKGRDDFYPRLAEIARRLPDTYGLVDAISRALSDRGEILDSASPRLASLRHQIRQAHDRLMARLQRYLTDPQTAPFLQEALITQRDGRYVIPLRAEFKGRIPAIVHDQSASGATLFIEPLPVVEANNELRQLQLHERDEEQRILAELSAHVAQHAVAISTGVEALAHLDLAFARAKYAEALRASEPLIRKPIHPSRQRGPAEAAFPFPVLRLIQARHPLLDPETVVPIDFYLPQGVRAVVITGPNTGGKTVALKTVGLLILMAQSGLHIPAQSGSELSLFHAVYADIGDEQSIQQSLSTFSGHISNIIRILKEADHRSLIVLDELGAGTDPQEGAALARAILNHLLQRGITTLVTTHHPELKAFAHATSGVVNASVEFDLETLRPTYQLTIGLPGRSHAIAIAQRLGLDPEIVAAAHSDIHPADRRVDKLLDDIRKERDRLALERQALERERTQLEAKTRELAARLEQIEEERRQTLARARAEGELEVAVLRRNLETLKRRLKRAAQPLEAIQAVEKDLQTLEAQVEAPLERRPALEPPLPTELLRPGERVRVKTLNAEGVVTAVGESDAEVQIGSLRVRARWTELERTSAGPVAPASTQPSGPSIVASAVSSPGLELNLRGMMVDDALQTLERHLEKAYLAGLPFVRIVHGKGTGKLRTAVRQALRHHPYVRSFEEAAPNQGGEGVTIVLLAK